MKLDKSVCIVMGSALLTLGSLSFVFCPTARAGGNASPPASASAAAPGDNDDGDELLEHWNNPAFAGEERGQMAGLAILLTGAGALSQRRRQKLRGNLPPAPPGTGRV